MWVRGLILRARLEPHRKLAKEYKTTQATISRIMTGKRRGSWLYERLTGLRAPAWAKTKVHYPNDIGIEL